MEGFRKIIKLTLINVICRILDPLPPGNNYIFACKVSQAPNTPPGELETVEVDCVESFTSVLIQTLSDLREHTHAAAFAPSVTFIDRCLSWNVF